MRRPSSSSLGSTCASLRYTSRGLRRGKVPLSVTKAALHTQAGLMPPPIRGLGRAGLGRRLPAPPARSRRGAPGQRETGSRPGAAPAPRSRDPAVAAGRGLEPAFSSAGGTAPAAAGAARGAVAPPGGRGWRSGRSPGRRAERPRSPAHGAAPAGSSAGRGPAPGSPGSRSPSPAAARFSLHTPAAGMQHQRWDAKHEKKRCPIVFALFALSGDAREMQLSAGRCTTEQQHVCSRRVF